MRSSSQRSTLALLLLVVTPAVRAQTAPPPAVMQQIDALATDDGAVQRAAVVALGESGDRKVIPALEALREESLYVWTPPSGTRRIVIARDKTTVDEHDLYILQDA